MEAESWKVVVNNNVTLACNFAFLKFAGKVNLKCSYYTTYTYTKRKWQLYEAIDRLIAWL